MPGKRTQVDLLSEQSRVHGSGSPDLDPRTSGSGGIGVPPPAPSLKAVREGHGHVVIKRGEFGRSVRQIQHRLCIEVDGHFYETTLTAVKAFQATNNLKVDGVVGVQTVNALFPQSGGLSPSEPDC